MATCSQPHCWYVGLYALAREPRKMDVSVGELLKPVSLGASTL